MEQQQQHQIPIPLLTTVLYKLLQDYKHKDQEFIKNLGLVCQQIQDQHLFTQADINISQMMIYIQQEVKKLQISEEDKGLVTFKQPKVKRLYVDGCFDMMHSGHYNAIRQAKLLCETLVVGVVSQEEIIRRKGIPVMNLEERMLLAQSCKWADEVVPNVPYDPTMELLDQLNCSHVGHGDDLIVKEDGTNVYQEFIDAGRFLMFKRTEGISTTDIVGRLLLMTRKSKDYQQMKQIQRKLSGDEGIKVSQVQEGQLVQKIENNDIDTEKISKVKLLNTTRRIRQFSADLKEPKQGDRIVYIDGSFDLLHQGHILALQKAKEQGDFLIVGLYDDDVINFHKGNNYPILSLQERVLNVLAMKYVDEVIMGAPWDVTENMIKQFNISIVVSGSHSNEELNYAVPKKLGIYKQLQSDCTTSTESLIERIIENRQKYLDSFKKKSDKAKLIEDQQKDKPTNCKEIF